MDFSVFEKCAIFQGFGGSDVKVLSELMSNRYLETRKPNKIKGLVLFSFHCRDAEHTFVLFMTTRDSLILRRFRQMSTCDKE